METINAEDANSNNLSTGSFLELLDTSIGRRQKDKVFATWYNDKGRPVDQYTFQGIWEEAGVVAFELLVKYNLNKGDKVVLCYNFGLQFYVAFIGCLRAGIVAVLIYPPSPTNLSKALPKMNKVIEDCDAKLLIVDNDVNFIRFNPMFIGSRHLWPKTVEYMIHPKKKKIVSKKQEACDFLLKIIKNENQCANALDDDLAFLQYTSGSTGNPKGVMVTFGALKSNVESIIDGIHCICDSAGFDYSKKDISSFTWLPQYHDMGLVYAMSAPFVAGWRTHMTSPLVFIQNPLIWIQMMSRLQVTWSVAPNFAFRLAVRKFNEAKSAGRKEPIANLDLSSIVYLSNASEPVQVDTKMLFEDTFGKYGLSQNWFNAAYGCAETVVYATDAREYKLHQMMNSADGKPSMTLVASGHRKGFAKDQVVIIVCPNAKKELADGEIGEVWLSGPSITAGYYGNPELTKEVFHAKLEGSEMTYLRTGDLAFFVDDYLYICGRLKDLVIVNGVNYYPQDIEYTVQDASPFIRPGCMAAFPSDDIGNDGNLEVVFEIREKHVKDAEAIVNTVRSKIIEEIGLIPSRVVAITERSIHKTTSGKIQRKANREALHNNSFTIIHEYSSSVLTKKLSPENTTKDASSEDRFDSIMISFFGDVYDPSRNWDDLGFSSMLSIQIRDAIADEYTITLSPDCFDVYFNPETLKQFVTSNQGEPLQINLPMLQKVNGMRLSWFMMGVSQGLCSILLLFMFAFPIVPAWYVGKALANMNAFVTIPTLGTNVDIVWFCVPIVVPTWIVGLSLSVILLKWIVIWKYKEGIISIPSSLYLRWWFVDRAMALWEFWVGRLVKDTPLISLFYFLMGAKIHSTVALDSFIREFDLVNIGEHTSLEHSLKCRKFGSWDGDAGPSLRLRSINIGSNCVVKGMTSLGASLGNEVKVHKLSVVPEGAMVPDKVSVEGNPAFARTSMIPSTRIHKFTHNWLFGLLKIVWLLIELYIFFGLALVAQYLWVYHLPYNWRYAPVLEWSLLLLWFSVVSTLLSVMMKWILIGKRRPGPVNNSLWRNFADWAADWHFRVSTDLVYGISSYSRIWNVVLWLYGMDIDFYSTVQALSFSPSKMDLVKIKQSFVSSGLSINVNDGKTYRHIELNKSSIGHLVHIEPEYSSDTMKEILVKQATIPPMSCITHNINNYGSSTKKQYQKMSCWELLKYDVLVAIGYSIYWVLLFCTFIPPYELWMHCFGNPSSIWVAVPALTSALALQTISWIFLCLIFQSITLAFCTERATPWSRALYCVNVDVSWALQTFSFISVTLGSPTYNYFVRMLGGKINGRTLLFPNMLHDFSLLSFEDKTIADSSIITGHYVVYNSVVLGPSCISGILHEGTYAANASICAIESEPCWRAFIGTTDNNAIDKGKTSQWDDFDEDPIIVVPSTKEAFP